MGDGSVVDRLRELSPDRRVPDAVKLRKLCQGTGLPGQDPLRRERSTRALRAGVHAGRPKLRPAFRRPARRLLPGRAARAWSELLLRRQGSQSLRARDRPAGSTHLPW